MKKNCQVVLLILFSICSIQELFAQQQKIISLTSINHHFSNSNYNRTIFGIGVTLERISIIKEKSLFGYKFGVGVGNADKSFFTADKKAYSFVTASVGINYSLGKRNSRFNMTLENVFRYAHNVPLNFDLAIQRFSSTYDAIANGLLLGIGYRFLSLKSGFSFQIAYKHPIIGVSNSKSDQMTTAIQTNWEFSYVQNSEVRLGGLQLEIGWAFPVLKREKLPKE